jgi:hypothetical protein
MTETADADLRLAELEKRVGELEDLLAIYRFTASYGPAVDSNTLGTAAEMWTDDGVYDIDVGMCSGRNEILGLFESRVHQDLVDTGCAHIVTPPRVSLHGDEAVITCYQQMIRNDNGQFVIGRMSANRWELVRRDGRWQIKNRVSRKLDGDPSAHRTLAQDL